MTEQSSSKNYNLIHIVCEVLALLIISFYFTSRINKLTKTVEVLCKTIEDNQKRLEEHEKLIKQLIQLNQLNNYQSHILVETPVVKGNTSSSVKLEPIEENKSYDKVQSVPMSVSMNIPMSLHTTTISSSVPTSVSFKQEMDIETDSVLDAELEDEYRDLQVSKKDNTIIIQEIEEEKEDTKKKSRSRSRSPK